MNRFRKKSKLSIDEINHLNFNNDLEIRIHKWLDEH